MTERLARSSRPLRARAAADSVLQQQGDRHAEEGAQGCPEHKHHRVLVL
jgi:hypothetical protein